MCGHNAPGGLLEGILFQGIMAYSWLDLAKNWVPEHKRAEAFRAVARLLWLIREAIVSATGAAPNKTVSDHYMGPSDDRLGAIVAAALVGLNPAEIGDREGGTNHHG